MGGERESGGAGEWGREGEKREKEREREMHCEQ